MTITAVLVANRGEIARRVFRTATQMGIRCVAVYSDADAGAPFVADAHEAVRLPGSYLDTTALIEAARRTGADAIHPGYGFLSENAAFADDVIAAGLTWIGPAPEAIAAMGDKLAAKRMAIDARVPTLASSDDPAAAQDVGFPLLVKAAAGGGGKGMRVVQDADGLADAVAAARREAASGFGDDRVFLERFIPRSRHVEIQVLGDTHGNLVHLGERECSIQRRHQKIVEEAPSPVVDPEMRAEMGDAALRLAEAIGYTSAGTVEFLVDDDTRDFYFLEMNTRLQVEHPVTEAVTGIDLVREQLRIAGGEPLDVIQEEVAASGHAIEARLYAEDPAAGFLPSTGTVVAFESASAPSVRWDSGVEAGSVVGVAYDPMLAKVTSHAPTRAEAAARLASALEHLHVGGVTTNRDFLAATLRHEAFLAGDTTTDFIERVDLTTSRSDEPHEIDRAAMTAALWIQGENRANAGVLRELPSGWRNARLPAQRVVLAHGEHTITVEYRWRRDGTFAIGTAGTGGTARVHRWSRDQIDAEIDGVRRTARVTRGGDQLHVQGRYGTATLTIVPRFEPPAAEGPAGGLVAPMPGVVLDVRATVGDTVEPGQVLAVLEAMKMEHQMRAPDGGVVTEVLVAEGQQVDNGAVLMVIDAGGDDPGRESHEETEVRA